MLTAPPRNSSTFSRYNLRPLLVAAMLLSGSWFGLAPLLAQSAPPGTITNQATGSFVDETDTTNTAVGIQSNTVQVTVVEVAGIFVTAATPIEAPTGVVGAGLLQGNGTINVGDIAYFDYTITNKGNDSTQFFIPDAPSSTVGGTFNATTNPIQIIAYNPTGAADIAVTGVNIPAGGLRTGPSTATGTDGLLGKNGIIPAGGSVKIRVPIKVTAAVGQSMTVIMGDTGATPLGQNQVYSNNNNLDIYTQDNPDSTIVNAAGDIETVGHPVNGDATNNRQEASASGTVTVVASASIAVSGTVFSDADADVAINGSDAGTNAGSLTLTVYAIDTAGNIVDKATVGSNGTYNLTNVPPSAIIKLRLTNDSTLTTAPTAPSLPTGWFQTGKNLNGIPDGTIATLGDINLTTTTTPLTLQNFGIRQTYVLPTPPVPTTCAANFTTSLNTGVSASGGTLAPGTNDLNWSVEWLDGPTNANGGIYAPPRPVGVMPAVVTGNLAPGAWVVEPGNAKWISYPFRLSTNSNGDHQDANLNGTPHENNGTATNPADAVRLKFTAKVSLPSNANTIAISLPVGVSVDNQFVSLKVNGVDNITTPNPPDPYVADFLSLHTVNITNGWTPGVNTIEIIIDSGPDLTGFFLSVNATTTQVCPVASNPNLLLVKRITGINGLPQKRSGAPLNAYENDTTNPYDDNKNATPTAPYTKPTTNKWPDTISDKSSGFLLGSIDGGTIAPNDSIEYTIYFLSAGDNTAKNVLMCDRVPDKVTFIPGAFNNSNDAPAGANGLPGADRGIAVNLGGTINSYTNVADGDFAQYFPPGSTLPSTCGTATNTNGAVVVNLGDIPNAKTAVSPPTPGSYGFVRFQGRVK
jgi:uncharacterized repeat protein (TIGR01451 family)